MDAEEVSEGRRARHYALSRTKRCSRDTCAVWREGKEEQFLMGYLTVQRFKRGWMRQPDYALVSGEPDA